MAQSKSPAQSVKPIQPPAVLEQIPVGSVRPSPYQSRRSFDPDMLQDLAASMASEGLVQPITVRRIGKLYELISGERRLRAAKSIGWKTIEAKIVEIDTDAEAAAMGLIENIQRENINPAEEAEGFKRLNQIDPKRWNNRNISRIIGKSDSYVSRSMAILGLPDPILESLRRRKLSRDHAVELLRLPTPALQNQVGRQIPGRLTREETRQLIDKILEGKAKSPSPQGKAGGVPSPDPLQECWLGLSGNSTLGPQGSWGVRYAGGWRWSLEFAAGCLGAAGASGAPEASEVGAWFIRLGTAMGGTGVAGADTQEPPLPLRERVGVRGASLDPATLAGSDPVLYIGSDPQKTPDLLDKARLPKTPAEQAEIEAAGRSGPAAVYRWIYGPASTIAAQMEGSTWTELGAATPAAGVALVLDAIRTTQTAVSAGNR